MSECRYFWTNFHKSVESDPVCPVTGAAGYWVNTTDSFFNLSADEYVGSVAAAPTGEDGYDLMDTAEATTSPQTTAEWVDLSQLGGFGVAIQVTSGGGGEGGGEG